MLELKEKTIKENEDKDLNFIKTLLNLKWDLMEELLDLMLRTEEIMNQGEDIDEIKNIKMPSVIEKFNEVNSKLPEFYTKKVMEDIINNALIK